MVLSVSPNNVVLFNKNPDDFAKVLKAFNRERLTVFIMNDDEAKAIEVTLKHDTEKPEQNVKPDFSKEAIDLETYT